MKKNNSERQNIKIIVEFNFVCERMWNADIESERKKENVKIGCEVRSKPASMGLEKEFWLGHNLQLVEWIDKNTIAMNSWCQVPEYAWPVYDLGSPLV